MAAAAPSPKTTRAYADAMAGADVTSVRPTPAAAFIRARQQFRDGVRLDMGALASDVGVARATLYRWTGDRDRLLADVCMADLDAVMTYLDGAVGGEGAARLEQLVAQFLETLAGNGALHRFLEQEGEHGMRIVTAADGRVRPRIVERLAEVIEREAAEHNYHPPAEPRVLADGIVALGERFLYHNGSPSLNPDPATARVVIRLLLREDGSGRAPATGRSGARGRRRPSSG
jgi:AcrR family transcriptional regulator